MARRISPVFDGVFNLGRLRTEAGPVTLTGLPPTARALALLELSRQARKPLTVVVASEAEAGRLARDLRGLAGLTGALDPSAVGVFPALGADPYDGLAAHLGSICERVRSLWRLMRGPEGITVVPAGALLIPLPPPDLIQPFFVDIEEDSEFEQADKAGWFVDAGYRRVDLVTEPGEYSRRGGILDIFPPIHDEPIRIELEGTRIVSMRRFDTADQRSIGRLERTSLSPARETVMGRIERENLRAALEAEPGSERLIELLETQGGFPGMAACARVIYPGARMLLDHVERLGRIRGLLVVDEPEMTLEELRQQRAEMVRAAAAASEGEAGLPAAEDLMVPRAEIEAALDGAGVKLRHLDIEEEMPVAGAPRIHRFQAAGIASYRGRLGDLMQFVRAELSAGRTVVLAMKTEGRAHRMKSLLADNELTGSDLAGAPEGAGGLYLATAEIRGGFSLPEAGLTVVAEQEIFGEEVRHRKKTAVRAFTSDFRDLNAGDLVVHVDHGVGRYEGLQRMDGSGSDVDVMVISYQGKDKLFVPVTRLDLVQKYSGVGGHVQKLDKLGGTGWVKTKQRVKKAMQDMAVELLNLYAARRTVEGHALGPDTEWQREFETGFPYELTPDQESAVLSVKRDLESTTPMDRLLCGDVGFGKTEVALRAAFKAVMDGKQVAVLAPTTVLVVQHVNTFRERFSAFPSRIESLSRFRTPKEIKATVAGLADGSVDIVIGTHRLLSKDVGFKDLGLLVVDEEQRFGVAHKERIKQLRKNVHVLTLTATPIPRTLQMSLMGVRDLSVIETPPENRLAIQTHLVAFREPIIASAIRHELARQGQVYFVHNRVETIHAMTALLKKLVPEAEIGVAHGKMPERELEEAMLRFLRGEFNVLVSTTIIENGLDIPRVNTLIVNRADKFGLSQLYQMRGRIGRSDRQAYAFLLVPPETTLTPEARKRLKALQDFSELGSGFRIAAMDLEIRGAGDLLGRAQHGHIAALGFELYCRMLERAVAELKEGKPEMPELRASINLGVDLKLPESYIADEHHRLMFYKRLASAASTAELDSIKEEMEDRYGRLPEQGTNIMDVAAIRLLAERMNVQQLDYRAGTMVVKFGEESPVDPQRLLRFVSRRPESSFAPPAVLRIKGERSETDRLAHAREILAELS